MGQILKTSFNQQEQAYTDTNDHNVAERTQRSDWNMQLDLPRFKLKCFFRSPFQANLTSF